MASPQRKEKNPPAHQPPLPPLAKKADFVPNFSYNARIALERFERIVDAAIAAQAEEQMVAKTTAPALGLTVRTTAKSKRFIFEIGEDAIIGACAEEDEETARAYLADKHIRRELERRYKNAGWPEANFAVDIDGKLVFQSDKKNPAAP